MATDSWAAELSPWTSTHPDTHLYCPQSVFPTPCSPDHQTSLLDRPVPDTPQHRGPTLITHLPLSSLSSASSVEHQVIQPSSACSSFPLVDHDNVSHIHIEDRDNHCGSCVEQRDNCSHSCVEQRDNHSLSCNENRDNPSFSCTEHRDNLSNSCTENRDNHSHSCTENRDNHSHSCTEHRDNSSHSCTEHRDNNSHSCHDHRDNHSPSCAEHQDNKFHSCTEHRDTTSTNQRLSSVERFSLKIVEDVAVVRDANVHGNNNDAQQLTSSGCSTPVDVDTEYVRCTSVRPVLTSDILSKGFQVVHVPSSKFNERVEDGGTRLESDRCADSKQEFFSVYQPTSKILGESGQSRQTHSEPRSHSRQTHSEPRPQSHQTHSEPIPQSHQTHSEPRPLSHQTHSEPRPQSHQTHSEQRPLSHQTHSEQRPLSHQTHSEPRPHSTPVWSCDFHDMTRNQALVKLSDDLRFYKTFYVLHSKCVSLGSRSFGPWCSKVSARLAKNGGVSPSKRYKESPPGGFREKTVTDRLWQTGAGRMASIRDKPRRNGGGREIVNSVGDKYTKTTDVFDRLSGQGAPYMFHHFADVTQYMSEYREQHTVGRVCRRTKKVPVMGVDVPDPYTCRKKKQCLCSDCSLLAKTKMAVAQRDGAAVDSESSAPGKDNSSPSKHVTRAVPNLAPVRERKATDTGSHGTKATTRDQQSTSVSRHSSSDPAPFPSLVLPTIHIQRDTKHMTLIGQSPPMENPLARSTDYTSPNPEASTSKTKHSDGDLGSSRKAGKTTAARLKYSKRSVVTEASVSRREMQATPPDESKSLGAGRNPDSSAARSEATSDKPSASKTQTGIAEASVCEKELRLPRIVSKELAGEVQSKREGRNQNKSFYTTFTQAQKIYANKHDPASHGDRDVVSLGEGTRGGYLGNIYGDLRSFGGNIRVYVGSKRSRSVEISPRNRVRARKELKAPHSSGNNSKKSDTLSVRVMSEDDLTTGLRHEDKDVLHLADFRHPGDYLLPTEVDPSLKSGPTDGENKVMFFLPDTEGQAFNPPTVGAKRTTKKDSTLANSFNREKSKGVNEPASQQTFSSRTQREKSTYFNISQKNTVICDSGKQVDTIGIRGRTIAEYRSATYGNDTPKPAQDKTFNSSDTIYRTPRADQDNEPETTSPRFTGKYVGRQPTFVLSSNKHGGSTCAAKTGTWTSPVSNVYRGSLLVQGGRLDGDLTTRTDQCDVETSATLPVKVEYRLPKDSAPPLDDKEHVTSLQA